MRPGDCVKGRVGNGGQKNKGKIRGGEDWGTGIAANYRDANQDPSRRRLGIKVQVIAPDGKNYEISVGERRTFGFYGRTTSHHGSQRSKGNFQSSPVTVLGSWRIVEPHQAFLDFFPFHQRYTDMEFF